MTREDQQTTPTKKQPSKSNSNLNVMTNERSTLPVQNTQAPLGLAEAQAQNQHGESSSKSLKALLSEQIPGRQEDLDGGLGDQYEFTNLNIKGNASESDDEGEQRIFQFSPLSSKKHNGDGEEGSGSNDDVDDQN